MCNCKTMYSEVMAILSGWLSHKFAGIKNVECLLFFLNHHRPSDNLMAPQSRFTQSHG